MHAVMPITLLIRYFNVSQQMEAFAGEMFIQRVVNL